jgi:hypothetical protein
MEWKEIKSNNDFPKKEGFYECYCPESKMFKESHSEFWFDGENFRDGDSLKLWTDIRMTGRKINKYISHWMKIERPV